MLKISPSGSLDLLSLGALVHRLDPGIIPFRKAHECQIHVSGGEFNVAANLADCFRMKTGVASAMVNYPIGDLIAERVRAMGVKPFYKQFEHDGVTGPNMATVYSDRGLGAGDGGAAVLQAFQARWRPRTEHGDGVQRSWSGRARSGRVLQPQQRSRSPVEGWRF